MNFLVDVVWNNMSLRTASTMHNEPLGGCCVEQYVLENCKYNACLGGCCLEQYVLENCMYNAQWTSWWMMSGAICSWELQVQCTMNLLVDVVWNNMSLRTVSTMNFLVDVV
jgi:hypothetical protein